jgi:hypothetical protein
MRGDERVAFCLCSSPSVKSVAISPDNGLLRNSCCNQIRLLATGKVFILETCIPVRQGKMIGLTVFPSRKIAASVGNEFVPSLGVSH